jgi:hypothetical protein
MKPVLLVTKSEHETKRSFPVVDFNYQTVDQSEFGSRCVRIPRYSGKFAREYFNSEARRDFVTEAAFFVILTATTVPAIAACASALVSLLRAFHSM